MKIVIFSILLFSVLNTKGQVCTEDIRLTTQSEINNFSTNYPNCSIFDGAIVIKGEDIVQLDSLRQIMIINGGLLIHQNPQLIDINGLQGVTQVNSITINGNPLLTNLNGLNNIEEAQEISILLNPLLNDLSALSNITGIQEISLYKLPALTEIDFMKNIIDFHGICSIINTGITSLLGFENITRLIELKIDGNEFLQNLNGLESLEEIEHLMLWSCPNIKNLNPLLSLRTVKILRFFRMHGLEDLSGLENLEVIEGWGLSLWDNTNLKNVLALENTNFKCNNISIRKNPKLSSLKGLENVKSIQKELLIRENENLENLDGLNNLDSIGLRCVIHGNTQLKNLRGLESLKSIYQYEVTSSFGDVLSISGHPNLETLDGIENLRKVGFLHFHDNPKLKSINAISKINPDLLEKVEIFDNASLSYCSINPICNFLNRSDLFLPWVDIENNASYCSSSAEILEFCLRPELKIYPNPTLGNITFNLGHENVCLEEYEYQLFNSIGLLVNSSKLPNNYEIELPDVAGFYSIVFIRKNEPKKWKVFKIIKLNK